jgi:hypothetical protein
MQRKGKTSIFGRKGTTRICLMGLIVALSLSTSWNSFVSRWHGPICDRGASDNELARCVARYSKPRLSPADIRKFIEHGSLECFVRGYPYELAEQARCLPLSLGVDERNGRAVELVYQCSDICPDAGGVLIRYANTSKEDCCAVGGYPWHDYAWGGYRGCTPPEHGVQRRGTRAYYPRYPDGPREEATRSPCDASKLVFDDGTVVEEATLWTE